MSAWKLISKLGIKIMFGENGPLSSKNISAQAQLNKER